MKNTDRRKRQRRGFSLIETLVSISLFALSAAAIGGFLTQQIRAAGANFRTSYAYTVAEEELEAIRALDYDQMVSRSSTKSLGATRFNIATAVTPNQPSANMKSIQVTVSWTDNSGEKNVTVSTVYAQVRR
jgi:prepilin-type N-terminal cleavage/methylation domain-containing protein